MKDSNNETVTNEGFQIIDNRIRWTLRAKVERMMYLPDERYLQAVIVIWVKLPPSPTIPSNVFFKRGIHPNFLPHLERSQNYGFTVLIDFFTDINGNNPEMVGLSVLSDNNI